MLIAPEFSSLYEIKMCLPVATYDKQLSLTMLSISRPHLTAEFTLDQIPEAPQNSL